MKYYLILDSCCSAANDQLEQPQSESERESTAGREYGKRASPYCKQIEKHIVKEPITFLNQSNVYSKLHTELRQMN